MKHLRLIPLCLTLIASLLLTLAPGQAQELSNIDLDAPREITAGDAWSVTVQTTGFNAGDTLQASILNGMSIYTTELALGTGGIARWDIEAGILTQAGTSQVTVSAGDVQETIRFDVLSDIPDNLQSFTTANSLTAYGDDSTALLTLVSDRYGNPVHDATLTVRKTDPSGASRVGFATSNYGLVSQNLVSIGNPGILRLQISYGTALEVPLTLVQLAGSAHHIEMTLYPSCVLADGIDDVNLSVTISDEHGNPINNGQIVQFEWQNGGAIGVTLDGNSALNIPAPNTVGHYRYVAHSGNASADQILEVTGEQCDD